MAAPVKHTCPDIDRLKDSLEDGYKSVNQATILLESLESMLDDHENIDDRLYDLVGDIKSELDELDTCLYWAPEELEDLRSSNSALRDWGEELESELNSINN